MLKAFLLLVSAVLFALAILPPQEKVKSAGSTKVYRGQRFESIVRTFAYLCCIEVVIALACNAAILLLQDAPHTLPRTRIMRALCPAAPSSSSPSALLDLHPRFLAGLVLVWSGALLRLWSYHALGELFTFEVLVKPHHRLITSGPYAFVRHPSYTGVALLLLGVQLMQFGHDGYMSVCHTTSSAAAFTSGPLAWMATLGGSEAMWIARSWQLASAYVLVSLGRRCRVEDGELKRKFGDVWVC